MIAPLIFFFRILFVASFAIVLIQCKPVEGLTENTDSPSEESGPDQGLDPSQDSAAPIISDGLPSGLSLPSGTTAQDISVMTDEESVCRFSTDAGDDFSSMMALEASPDGLEHGVLICLLYTSPSPRDRQKSRMPSSA